MLFLIVKVTDLLLNFQKAQQSLLDLLPVDYVIGYFIIVVNKGTSSFFTSSTELAGSPAY